MPAGSEPHPRESGCRFARAKRRPAEGTPFAGFRRIPKYTQNAATRMGGCRFGIPAGSEPEGFARAKRRSADSSPARRHGRQRAMLAASPVAPAAPLPKNLASLRFSGALFLSCAVDPSLFNAECKIEDGFDFQRSFGARGLRPRLLRMTGEGDCAVPERGGCGGCAVPK